MKKSKYFGASLVGLTLAIGSFAAADKVVSPTPELRAAVKNITSGEIVKVEEERSGVIATYEVSVNTPNRAVEEVELTRDGFQVISAEGNFVANAQFDPGQELRTLTDLTAALKKYPSFTANEWEFDRKLTGKFQYEVSGVEDGREVEYIFDASNLALLDTNRD